jgi:hypothetical protein
MLNYNLLFVFFAWQEVLNPSGLFLAMEVGFIPSSTGYRKFVPGFVPILRLRASYHGGTHRR